MAAGAFINDAAIAAGSYRKQGRRWLAAVGGVRPRRGRNLKGPLSALPLSRSTDARDTRKCEPIALVARRELQDASGSADPSRESEERGHARTRIDEGATRLEILMTDVENTPIGHVPEWIDKTSNCRMDPMSHVRRFDHVGITVANLDTVTAFFVGLGLEVEGRTFVEGEFLDTVIGIPDSRTEIVICGRPTETPG